MKRQDEAQPELAFWRISGEALLGQCGSSLRGLSAARAAARLKADGPNAVVSDRSRGLFARFAAKLLEPLVAILLCAAAVSGILGDWPSFLIVLTVVLASAILDTWQEHRAQVTAETLRRSVAVTTTALRDGRHAEVHIEDLVVGDVVDLAPGDLVPADGVVLASQGCQTNEAVLTGEPFPVEKRPGPVDTAELAEAANALFAGTAVVAGTATMLVVTTGTRTRFGRIAATLQAVQPPTAFERGLRSLGTVILRLTLVLVLIVMTAHIAMGRGIMETLFFAVALAVGLTPELLPMVMTVTLSRGALQLAKRKVIVRRLSSIHDCGSMDVLCTDKTGTLTEAKIALADYAGVDGENSARVLALAQANSRFASGLRNNLDDAILGTAAAPLDRDWTKVAELPFDFERRRASVLLGHHDVRLLIVKGAPEEILLQSARIELPDGSLVALDASWRAKLAARQARDAAAGLRLLGIAWRKLDAARQDVSGSDERDLVFVGFCAFFDPPKSSATQAIARLERAGVAVKVISGDAEAVVRHVAANLSVPVRAALTGAEIAELSDAALAVRVDEVDLFARVSPDQKTRIVHALQARGRTVGFIGDGVNDAPSIRAADVGLSVDGATEVARAAADIILLAPDLGIVADGVEEGRRTYHNIMKYVRMGTSSNFGNMLSMAIASLALPFLPLTPVQILLNNLLYDLSEVGLPFDAVEADSLKRPRHWAMCDVVRFTLVMGPLSSMFDIATFAVLLGGLHVAPEVFRTAWFIQSIVTQIAVVYVIRTMRPIWASRPHPILMTSGLVTILCAFAIITTRLGTLFGFTAMPIAAQAAVALLGLAYLVSAELLKRFAVERSSEPGGSVSAPGGVRDEVPRIVARKQAASMPTGPSP